MLISPSKLKAINLGNSKKVEIYIKIDTHTHTHTHSHTHTHTYTHTLTHTNTYTHIYIKNIWGYSNQKTKISPT